MVSCNTCSHDDLGYRSCCKGIYRPDIFLSPEDECTHFEPKAEVK